MALADEWSVIQPTNGLHTNAAKLADRYDLRARDALQLAAALEWCERIPQAWFSGRRSGVVGGGCAPQI
jgi:hypothetical protein